MTSALEGNSKSKLVIVELNLHAPSRPPWSVLVKFHLNTICMGTHGDGVGLRHRATNRKVAGSIPDGDTGIFH